MQIFVSQGYEYIVGMLPIDHLRYKGPREKPLQEKRGLVWAFHFRKSTYRPFVGAFTQAPYTEVGTFCLLTYSSLVD
jgi:hypothetical protein